jgi:hypothetical protein
VQYKTSAAQSDQDQERNSRSGPDGLFEMPPSRATEQEAPAGGLPAARTYHEEQIQKAITWFTSYLRSEREGYYAIGRPLDSGLRERMDGYFETELLDRVRVLELRDSRVANPWFYPIAREEGVRHLPDITHKAAVTFLDVVVFNEKLTSRDLFHGLVHAAQVSALGLDVFVELFVRGFLRARSYFLVPLKAQAFSLDARFAANPNERFSVEEEIREWRRDRRY